MRARKELSVAIWLLVALVLSTGCEREGRDERAATEPLVAFDTAAVGIHTDADTIRLTAEVAETEEQRSYGLMERSGLPADHGMIFLYPERQEAGSGFWMYRTYIPLDIAFLDEEGRIVAIRSMEPCGSPNPRLCRTYSPDVPYSAALEVSRGYFDRHGIEVGDRVVLLRSEAGAATGM